MLEPMVGTKSWKAAQRLIEHGRCRVCHRHNETLEHVVAGCTVLFNSEYLARHSRALMIIAVTSEKEHKFTGADTVWYKGRWERWMVLENDKAKLVWDFQFNLRKTETTRRPELILETKDKKQIWICGMACATQQDIDTKWRDKLMWYRQLAFETK